MSTHGHVRDVLGTIYEVPVEEWLCRCGHALGQHGVSLRSGYDMLGPCTALECRCQATRSESRPLPERDRFWAVGCNPARYAHRVAAECPGHGYVQAVCGAHIALHGDTYASAWPFPLGGLSFETVAEIPREYVLCLKCVHKDTTVE